MDLHYSNGTLQVKLILVETAGPNDTQIDQDSQNSWLESQDQRSTDLCRNYFFSLTLEDAREEISCVP